MRILTTDLLVVTSTLLTGCGVAMNAMVTATQSVQGSGTIVTQEIPVEPFIEVEIGGAMVAELKVGETPGVEIQGDDNLLPLIDVSVVERRLRIHPKANTSISPTAPLTATITAPSWKAITAQGAVRLRLDPLECDALQLLAQGASEITVEGINVEVLTLRAEGASTVRASGQARQAVLVAQGASGVLAADLTVETATVTLNGASRGEARATASIEGEVTGASNLSVLGEPERRAVRTAGAGSVAFRTAG